MNDLYVPNEGLLWVTAAALVGWCLLVALIWAVRYPRQPGAGPETTDLGAETPALANLLTHRFKPTRDAVPATLVDLAARGLVEIEDRGIGDYYCRVTGRAASLNAYEKMLLDHLRKVAAGGIVPAAALTTGPQDRSKSWWNGFRDEVVKHAQAEGLSRNLWDNWARGALLVVAAVIFLMFETAIGFNDPEYVAPSTVKDVVMVGGLLAFVLVFRTVASKRQTSTPAGDGAASRWLGVRRALEESPSFELLPPSGVIVWERHLAYAAALGVAPRSTRALPMGAESDDEAWTASSGEWRKVKVRYPRLRPGWGRRPVLALLIGGFGSFVGYNMVRLGAGEIGFDGGLAIAGTVATVLGAVVLLRSAPQLAGGFLDLFATRDVEGVVLRARTRWGPIPYPTQGDDRQYLRCYVALDDGRSTTVTAYRVSTQVYDRIQQGSRVRLTVTPRLGYVAWPESTV